jgi:hypothetical protein
MTPADKAWVQRAVDWLLTKQTKDGTWGYPDMTERYYDHSNTQYALLGLKSAARCGAKIPSRVWRQIAEHWISSQKMASGKVELKLSWSGDDPGVEVRSEESVTPGAWGYFIRPVDWANIPVPDQGYGSMVCAGLTSLIICQSELIRTKDLDEGLRPRLEAAKRAGLGWLQCHYSVRGCPPAAGFWSVFHLYYTSQPRARRRDVSESRRSRATTGTSRARSCWCAISGRMAAGFHDEIPVLSGVRPSLLEKATLKVVTKQPSRSHQSCKPFVPA